MASLFDVDVRGLQQTLLDEAPRVLLEPLSNALDTAAADIVVRFDYARGIATYVVEDDDPTGFSQLADAFTLFAPSTRKGDALKRGRFGFGEKEFIALAYPGPVTISTTTGTVTFEGNARTVSRAAKACRPAGSAISARVRLSREAADAFLARLRALLVPDGVRVTLHLPGETRVIAPRPALRTVDGVTLPTVLADADGILRPTKRQTRVTVHEVLPGETPTLYELGVPVVAHPGPWHLNVHQKVPLSRGRDSVTPAYLRALYVAVLDAAVDLLSPEAARADWVAGALAEAAPATLRAVVTKAHGANAVIADPSCPEATKRAIETGRPVIYSGSFSADAWAAIREHQVLRPAGHFQELRGDIQTSADGIPPIPEADWQPAWRPVAAYARALALALTGKTIAVTIYRQPHGTRWAGACWSNGDLSLNAAHLRADWWVNEQAIDELLLHEFAHQRVSDHLSDAFHTECCRLGALLRNADIRLATFRAHAGLAA